MNTILKNLPNIGPTLYEKLIRVDIDTVEKLKRTGSIGAIQKLAGLKNSGVCLNMLFALEGAIQNIRWHKLTPEKKEELKQQFKSLFGTFSDYC